MSDKFLACRSCLNRRVRVFMRNGEIFEGTLVDVNSSHLFLDCSTASISSKSKSKSKKAKVQGFGFFNPITALVLFDLLAIALLV